MYKILLPNDGSENALRAVHYAVSLARDHRAAALHLVTVQTDPILYGEIAVYLDQEKLARALREQSEALLKPAEEVLRTAGVSYDKEILVGDVAPSIVRRAEELGCRVIVMGTRGMGALANLMLGSVATKVVHLSKLPVTLIK
jgi:nucleotide-binding universal stress UspA family protein